MADPQNDSHEPIYPPLEDSDFLAGFVSKHARGKTLDMGCGSGIQAKTAARSKEVSEVVALDKNKNAVRSLTHEIKSSDDPDIRKISVIESDMFSAVEDERFDTIICNPPYLPNDPGVKDIALYGGEQGHEWSIRFLNEAKNHLSPNGQILFLFSNLTNKDLIDRSLKEMHYHHESLGELYVGMFEQLYVYRIWRLQ